MQNIRKLSKYSGKLLDILNHGLTTLNYAGNCFHSFQHVGMPNDRTIQIAQWQKSVTSVQPNINVLVSQ